MTVDEIKMRFESIAEWLDEDLPTEGDVRMAKAELAELRQLLQAVVSGSLPLPSDEEIEKHIAYLPPGVPANYWDGYRAGAKWMRSKCQAAMTANGIGLVAVQTKPNLKH